MAWLFSLTTIRFSFQEQQQQQLTGYPMLDDGLKPCVVNQLEALYNISSCIYAVSLNA